MAQKPSTHTPTLFVDVVIFFQLSLFEAYYTYHTTYYNILYILTFPFHFWQVFQDIVLPMNQLEDQIDVSEELFDLYPILIYPCRIYNHGPHRFVSVEGQVECVCVVVCQ